jgi:hypothetical protein
MTIFTKPPKPAEKVTIDVVTCEVSNPGVPVTAAESLSSRSSPLS